MLFSPDFEVFNEVTKVNLRGGGSMEEVIIIRIIDSNGSAFTSIMSALQKEQLKIADVTIIDQLVINIGEIRIHPS